MKKSTPARKELIGVNPFDPNLTTHQKQLILDECKENVWYFVHVCCRTPQEVILERG